MKLALIAVAATAAAGLSGASAAVTPSPTLPCLPLCGTKPQELTAAACTDQTLTSTADDACCDDGLTADSCVANDFRKCRTVQFDTAFGCNAAASTDHCIQPAQTIEMLIDILIDSRPGTCCASCTCEGDPHCYSFNAQANDWIICDARNVQNNCVQSQAICLQQLDQLGNQCQWNAGSQTCDKNPLTAVPQMTFFAKGSSSVVFNLGDRGIISQIVITEGSNVLNLTAAECKVNPINPWVGTPIGTLTSEKFGKVWVYEMNAAGAEVQVTCVGQGTLVKLPHLDVTLVATGFGPGVVPPTVTGFCATGVVAKGLATHAVSDAIQEGSLCSKSPVINIAQHFNGGNIVSPKKLTRVIRNFCQKYMLGFEQVNKGKGLVKQCYKNIVSKKGPGWAKVFCAANTLVSKNPLDCVPGTAASIDCITCTADIQDFGWDYAINKWDITKTNGGNQGPTCLATSQLPPDLTECQRGIRVQYLVPTTQVWTTYKAIPSGYTLCRSSGGFNSVTDAVLFQFEIRFTQCGLPDLPPGTCPDQAAEKCNAEDGFTVSLTTKITTEVPALAITELVSKGTLICSPTLYPGKPTACFSEPLSPCTSCTGPCAGLGYTSPCGPATADTCSMCVDPFGP